MDFIAINCLGASIYIYETDLGSHDSRAKGLPGLIPAMLRTSIY